MVDIRAADVKRRVLTDAFVKSLPAAPKGRRYTVTDTLITSMRVKVSDTGVKSFVLWRRLDPRASGASALVLGRVGVLTLAQAREKARLWLSLIAIGKDPRAEERVARLNEFGQAMQMYLTARVRGKQRKAKDVEREICAELLPRFANRPLAAITRGDIVRMINEIAERGAPFQARNAFGHVRTFYNWAVENELVAMSPCSAIRLARLLGPKPTRTRVLTHPELRSLWAATEVLGYPAGPFIRMLALTGQRRGEVAGARWREFDLANRLWTIPEERFKSGCVHVVPLSDQMLALIASLPRWAGGDCLFSNTGGRSPIGSFERIKLALDAAMGGPQTFCLHDIRRTTRSELSALRIQDHVAEMVIGHARKGLQRTYDMHRYESEKSEALAAWGDRLDRLTRD
jgi:integrase